MSVNLQTAIRKVRSAYMALTKASDAVAGHARFLDVTAVRSRCSGLLSKLTESERLTKVAKKKRS